MEKKNIFFGVIATVTVFVLMVGATVAGQFLTKSDQEMVGGDSMQSEFKNKFEVFTTTTIGTGMYPDTDLGAEIGTTSLRFSEINVDTITGGTISLTGSALESFLVTGGGATTTIAASSLSTFPSSVTFNGTTTTIDNLVAGTLELPLNGGLMDLINVPVSSAASDTVPQGYNLLIDGFRVFQVYAYDSANDGNASGTMFAILGGKKEKSRIVTGNNNVIVGDYHINVSSTVANTQTLTTQFIQQAEVGADVIAVIDDIAGNAGTYNITIATQDATPINGNTTITGNYNATHVKCWYNGTSYGCKTF